jgi:ADP-heptose:LPS heptosyltransferase
MKAGHLRAGFTKFKLVAHIIRNAVVTTPAIATGRGVRMLMNRRLTSELPVPAEVRSVLIVALDHLGDLILSSVYFRDVRAAFPAAKVTLLVDKRFENYAQQCPYVDDVVGFDLSGSQFQRAFVLPFRAFQFGRQKLWKRKFDVALNHRWDVDSVNGFLLGLFSLAKVHAGYSNDSNARKKIINRGANGAFSRVLKSTELIHESERGPELLRFLNLPSSRPAAELWPLPGDEDFAARQLPRGKYELLIALGIGASQQRRQWPMDSYKQLVGAVLEDWPTAHFLVVGNGADREQAEELRGALGKRLLNFAGKCTVTQSGALLSRCALYVGSDSGPMHMASAGGVPVVELSCHPLTGAPDSAHSPVRYHPLSVPYVVLQPSDFVDSCHYECLSSIAHCMLGVSVDNVIEAVKELLANWPMNPVEASSAWDNAERVTATV